jgi:fatty-acyl-CoA synthase
MSIGEDAVSIGTTTGRPETPFQAQLSERLLVNTHLTLWDLLDRAAERFPDRPAVVMGARGYSFSELLDRTLRSAAAFQALGIGKGTRVALLFHSCPDWAVVHYALMRLGAVAVPVNLTYEAREMRWLLEQTEPEVVISIHRWRKLECEAKLRRVSPAFEDGATSVPELPSVRRVLMLEVDEAGWVVPGRDSHEAVYGTSHTPLAPAGAAGSEDPAYIIFTSGTTAFPKGAACPHRAFTGGSTAYAACLRMTEEDRFIGMLPVFHLTGPVMLGAAHCVGAAMHMVGVFDTGRILDEIEKGRCTCTVGFPTNITKLMGDPTFADRDLSSFQKMNIGGTAAYHDHVRAAWPMQILGQPYGSTECGGAVALTDPDDPDPEAKRTANGTILPGIEVRVMDLATGERCPPGTPGEICYRGWCRFLGYLPGTAPGDRSIDEDGFFHSGDYGHVDETGHLYYRGRYKMMIKTGGENVSEVEIEMFLEGEIEEIEVAQVVGVPDSVWGEAVLAFVQLRPEARDLSSEELRELCRGKIASFKIPRRFVVMRPSDWPLAASGKMDKPALRKLALEHP